LRIVIPAASFINSRPSGIVEEGVLISGLYFDYVTILTVRSNNARRYLH